MIVIDNDYIPRCCGDCYVGFTKQIGCEKHIGFENYAIERHPDCPIKCDIEDIKADISDRLGLLDCKKDILAIIDKYTSGADMRGDTDADSN